MKVLPMRFHCCAKLPMWIALLLVLSACGVAPPTTMQVLAPRTNHILPVATATPPVVPRSSAQPLTVSITTAVPAATLLPTSTPTPQPTPTPVPTPNPLTGVLDGYLTRLTQTKRFQGSVLVAQHGNILLSKGYGWANAREQVPNSPQTRFRLASLSKQFTAMAIMQLQARGKLKVHDPICMYLVDCPQHWSAITIHHLLTHTSGLPNYTEFPSFDATRAIPVTPEDLVARFRQRRLLSAPGAVFKYENSDYLLLGMIIERVSGQPYADFLRDAIFIPLGMSASGVAPSVADPQLDALGYRTTVHPSPPLEPSTLYGCGSLASTVEDLYRWESALSTDQLLPAAELAQIFTPYQRHYGYGWFVQRTDARLRIGHPGKIDGFATSIVRYPEDGMTIIVLSNLWSTDADGISARLAELVFNG